MAGRKVKFTETISARFLEAIQKGHTIKMACALAGIGVSTYYRWEQVATVPNGRETATTRALRQFWEAVKKAEAEAQANALDIIMDAAHGRVMIEEKTTTRELPDGSKQSTTVKRYAPGEWQAAAWYLERRNKEWQRSTRIDIQSEARRISEEIGVPVEELLAEAEVMANGRA